MPFIATVKIKNWDELEDYLHPNRFAYIIWERIDEIKFDRWKNVDKEILQNTVEGIIFGENAELRWKKRENGFHIMIISDEDQSTLPNKFSNMKEINDIKERKIYLWGGKQFENKKPQYWWFELQIPRILKYPISNPNNKKDRVVAFIKEYYVSSSLPNGKEYQSRLYRWVDIQEVYKNK